MNGEGLDAIVLAGGASRRFGSDKASALLAGRPLLAWVVDAVAPSCASIVVVSAPGRALPDVGSRVSLRVVEDREPDQGPLVGLLRGLEAAQSELCFAAGCDAPLLPVTLPAGLAAWAGGVDAVVPRIAGRLQPLVAVYRRDVCIDFFARARARGERSLNGALSGLRVREPGADELRALDPELDAFRNANDMAALREIAAILNSRRHG